MKLKDKQALQQKTLAQLQADLTQAVPELAQLRLDLKTNQLKNLHLVTAKRRQIALLKTLITQKQSQPQGA